MVLKDFQVSGNQTLVYQSGEFSDDKLILSDLTVDNAGSGINIGTASDPFTFDIDSSSDGRWVIEFPDNNIDQTDVVIDRIRVADGGFSSGDAQRLGMFSVENTKWAGGTRFELGTNPGGGLALGLGIVLNGDIELEPPTGESDDLDMRDIGGFNSCWNGPTNFNIDTDCSGVLNWASLDEDRPLRIDFTNSNELVIKLDVPSTSSPDAGQLVVENANFANTSYGEIWSDEIKIGGLEVRALSNQTFNSDPGNDDVAARNCCPY
jgi:hypothetical protein